MLGTEITAMNKIYIIPALVGSIGYKRDQQTFPVKGQMVTILGLLVTYSSLFYFYKPKKTKTILRPHPSGCIKAGCHLGLAGSHSFVDS